MMKVADTGSAGVTVNSIAIIAWTHLEVIEEVEFGTSGSDVYQGKCEFTDCNTDSPIPHTTE